MKKLRQVFSGEIRGDCCSHDIYEPIEPMTVQELCDEIIKNKGEWGYIGISKRGTIFGDPNVEYFHGQYVDDKRNPIGDFKFPPQIANAYVKRVDWDGGWSRADWIITI